MAASSNRWVILGAMAANALIAVAKFTAAAITGSSAMLSEAIHSVVDTGDSGLLWLGEHMSQRPPDAMHPFGHGREIFFWSFLVAIIMFGVGGGMSIYEGLGRLVHPAGHAHPWWNYGVLGFAFLFDGTSWILSARAFWRAKPVGQGVWRFLHRSKNPSVYTVLLEDSTDLIGLVLAFTGVWVSHLTRNPYPDGVASILIGCLLGAVAVFLAWESRGLLVGEAADPEAVARICQLAQADPAVRRVNRPLTMQLGPHQVLLNLAIEFREGLSLPEVEAAVNRVEAAIRGVYPEVQRIFIEAKSLGTARGRTAST